MSSFGMSLSVRTLCLKSSGVYDGNIIEPVTRFQPEDYYPTFVYSAGGVYLGSGQVLNPVNGDVFGTYGSSGPLALEPSVNRV